MRSRAILISFFLFFAALPLAASSAQLEADRQSLSATEMLTLTLTIVDDEKEDVVEVREPDLPGFDIENRGESTSSSVSIINGKVSARKERVITYILRPQKGGQFTLGPATLVLEKGREIRSNQVRVTVVGTGAAQGPQGPAASGDAVPGAAEGAAAGLFAPLSAWEKQTERYFLRVVLSPEGPYHQGEPIIASYYLFTQKNLISDLSFYRFPSFENAWSEEIAAPKKLSFSRANIDGAVYDYALIKQYLLVPAPKAARLAGTQMILDVMSGGFFDMRKRSLSSIALDVPFAPLPDADQHPRGVVGDLALSQDRTVLALDAVKPLDTITYTVTGCGDLHHLELAPAADDGLKIFAPDVKQETRVEGGRLCGAKSFSFMVKALRPGARTLAAPSFDCWDRAKGWRTVTGQPVAVTIGTLPAENTEAASQKKNIRYELLRDLPAGVVVYDLSPLTGRGWFQTMLFAPLGLLALTALWLGFRALARGRRARRAFVLRTWEERIAAATDPSTLLNASYDAVKAVSGVALRGARKSELEKRFPGRAEMLLELVNDIQAAAYGGGAADLSALREKAVAALRAVGATP